MRALATAANQQPAMATYLRPHGESAYRLVSVTLLRIDGGLITEMTNIYGDLLRRFELPPTM